jgi:hypothetical protein
MADKSNYPSNIDIFIKGITTKEYGERRLGSIRL